MKSRIFAAACVVLVLVLVLVGGSATWKASEAPRPLVTPSTVPPSVGSASAPRDGPGATDPMAPSGRPVAGCADTSPQDQMPDRYWGMHVTAPVGPQFPEVPIAAVNLTTSGTYWNNVETAPGQYDFSLLDSIAATSEDRDAQPMVVLGFTPSFHSLTPESRTVAATMPGEDAWRAWVTTIVRRYGDRLDYQVWPEPNIVSNWSGTPSQMALLTVIAGKIVHKNAPDALVVAPATTLRLDSQRKWMSRYWATEVAGVPVSDSVDAVALDPFPLEDGTPEDSLTLICRARKILEKHDVDLPLWTNEINYGVPSGGTTGVKPYPNEQQAAVVGRTYILHAALGIDRVYWLGWFSYDGLAVAMIRDGVATPAGQAFTTVHDWMSGGRRPVCEIEKGLYTCVVDRDDSTLRILWRERGTMKVIAADGATSVEDLAGHSRRLREGDVVRVGQSPVAILESAN